METIKVIICEDGISCREVNRFEKLEYKAYYAEMAPILGKKATIAMYHRNNYNWDEAEQKLRVFTLDTIAYD
jgi:hypothetical protein